MVRLLSLLSTQFVTKTELFENAFKTDMPGWSFSVGGKHFETELFEYDDIKIIMGVSLNTIPK